MFYLSHCFPTISTKAPTMHRVRWDFILFSLIIQREALKYPQSKSSSVMFPSKLADGYIAILVLPVHICPRGSRPLPKPALVPNPPLLVGPGGFCACCIMEPAHTPGAGWAQSSSSAPTLKYSQAVLLPYCSSTVVLLCYCCFAVLCV